MTISSRKLSIEIFEVDLSCTIRSVFALFELELELELELVEVEVEVEVGKCVDPPLVGELGLIFLLSLSERLESSAKVV